MDILTELSTMNREDMISVCVSVMTSAYYFYNFFQSYIGNYLSPSKKKIFLWTFFICILSLLLYVLYQHYMNEKEMSNIEPDKYTDFIDEVYGKTENSSIQSLVKKEFVNGFMDGTGNNVNNQNKDLHFIHNLPENDMKYYLDKEIELRNYINNENIITPKYKVLSLNLPLEVKQQVIKRIESMHSPLNPFSERDQKWVESFLKIPFDKLSNIPINNIKDKKQTNIFFNDLKNALNSEIYGQEKTKIKIYELMAQWFSNQNGVPPVIGLCGPPGIGKTSLIRNLSKVLNRPFAFINMGGLKDGNELKGHSQTYVGSVWGKFIQILMEKQVMNPCIFMDELDKISESNKNEISGVLMHIIDPAQNATFQDSYFHGVDIDISKTIFIFSFNDKTLINRVLLDRMSIIDMEGYLMDDKIKIVKNHSLPNILKNVGLKKNSVTIDDEAITYLISNKCRSEVGMRDLIHKIEDIIGKINLCKLLHNDPNNMVVEELQTIFNDITFPMVIDKKLIDKIM